jgi:polyhydroxyalkanoate synthesis regulator phasin
MKRVPIAVAMLLAVPTVASSASSEKEELLMLKNTTTHLIDRLVKRGILDKEEAALLVKQSQKEAAEDTKQQMEQEKTEAQALAKSGKGESAPVRVTYVPDFVKEEIRRDVRAELRDEVVKEVKSQAKNEQWGIPAALPEWVGRIKPTADFRIRFEDQIFDKNNDPFGYQNYPATNVKYSNNGQDNWWNTTEDRTRYRIRLRLGMEAQVADHLKAGVRVTTSNDRSPISINQTLGQYGQQYQIALDRAFLQYDYVDGKNVNWFSVWGGRFANPFFSTDNMHDPDLNFEGLASTFHMPFNTDSAELKGYKAPNPTGRQQINMGNSKPNELFLTLGAFPLQEIAMSSHDKWMWAAQGGGDWLFTKATRLKAGIAYYDYRNITAVRDPLGGSVNDWTAPQFFTHGNTLAQISNDVGESPASPRLVGLAAQYKLIDALVSLDYSGFDDNTHVMLTGNFTDNIGYNQQKVAQQVLVNNSATPKTKAYQVRLDVGQPIIEKFGDWGLWFAYKYLERDSVLDAFTDSNFHLSGTDAKGWVAGANFGLMKNTWANIRWLSSDAISGPKYSVDVLLVDLNARF